MRVAVTGGTGYLGAHSVKALVDRGHRVRLLVREGTDPERSVGALGVDLADHEVVRGDVCEPDAVQRLLEGSDALLHAAGVVGTDDREERRMWEVNVGATATVLAGAVTLGLDPVVHVASYSALYPSPDAVIGPDSPTAEGRSAYGRTKAVGDRIARGFQAAGAPVVITYPSTVVGPPAGDRRGITAEGWEPLLRFGASITFEGGMAMIDVRDVADVHAAAMEPGRGPRRYLCGGELVPFADMVTALSEASGRRVRRVPIRPSVLRGAGRLADAASRLLPLPPSISYEAAWLLTRPTPTDDSVTLSELGLTWRPPRQALADAVRAEAGVADPSAHAAPSTDGRA